MVVVVVGVVGVLSEVSVTVGVPEASAQIALDSQCPACIFTNSEVPGVAYVGEVGSYLNKSSCLGIETGGGGIPESYADDDPIIFYQI